MTDSELVDAICALDEHLTAWELDFAEAIAIRVEGGLPLTSKQRDSAEDIIRWRTPK